MFDGIVIFSTNVWPGVWYSGHYMARSFARRLPVLYIEPRPAWNPRELDFQPRAWLRAYLGRSPSVVGDNLHVLTPRSFPLARFNRVRRLDSSVFRHDLHSAFKRLGWSNPLCWVYYYPGYLEQLELLGEFPFVYDCVDYSAREEERELTRRASLVVVRNKVLWEQKKQLNPRAYWIPNGVDIASFQRASKMPVPDDIAMLPTPRAGLVASLNHSIDYSLLLQVARNLPDVSLVLVGQLWRGRQFGIGPKDSKRIEELKSRPNVHWLGHKPPAELARYLFAFDVGLVAYKDTPFDRARDPLKVYQYLAAGKPIVSTPLTAFERAPRGVYIANNGQEFCTKVRTALAEAEAGLEERIRFGRAADWSERCKLTEQVLEQTFPGWCRKYTITAEVQSATGSN